MTSMYIRSFLSVISLFYRGGISLKSFIENIFYVHFRNITDTFADVVGVQIE